MTHVSNPPATIAEAFDEWLKWETAAHSSTCDEEMSRCTAETYRIEKLALTLPALAASDVWKLIRMTTDKENEMPHFTADMVVARAYAECAQ